MAKTIHDLAVAYGKEHQGTVNIEFFEDGANAVLERIKEAANNCSDIKLLTVIKELEGK